MSEKFLVVIPSLGRGGAERSASRLSVEWAKHHDVTLAVFDGSRDAFPHGGRRIDLGAPAGGGLRGVMRRVARLRRLMRSLRPDRIFAFTETVNIPVLLAALLSGYRARVTLSMRGNPDRMRWFHRLAALCLYGLAARVVVVSHGAASRLAALVPTCRGKLQVIYTPLPLKEIAGLAGVEEVPFPASESTPEMTQESIPKIISKTAPYFFAAGRLVRGKAFDRMLEIFAAADCPGARLLIAGEGPERARLQSLILARGLEERVRLMGALENPFALMARARAFLMTSEDEGFPVVLVEAFACGCPPIVFDCDFGPREAVADGESGFLVPIADNARFAARMEQLYADEALRARMGAAARLRARDFDAVAVADRWLRSTPEAG
jgi:GalNAc-alpha-(1->4)-GalNAc-alpha-(1->3)-diNAcBac-PP-undecaprenol alpha-1,4-N-acetyl-D-galactosaminyltransferase